MRKIVTPALALLLTLFMFTPGALAVEHIVPLLQPEEEALPDVWTEVSTAEELFAAGGSAARVRLTEDLTVTAADAQFFPFWTPTTLDMNGHCIRVARGGCFAFGGGAYPLILIGDGGETGLLQVEPGGELQIENIDASQVTGLLVRQAEGGWLVTQTVTAAPEQIIYAQAPVLRENFNAFAVLPQGLTREEVVEWLPELLALVNFQGQYEAVTIPADQLSWDLEAQWPGIEAGRRTLLHAQPAGPLSLMGWPESELPPVLFDALTCELAILVDGAAIGKIAARNFAGGSSYALSILLPNQVQPDGYPLSLERSPAFLELSLDNGETWLSASVGEDVDTDVLFIHLSQCREDKPGTFQANLDVLQETDQLLIRAGANYWGEGYCYRLSTDTLSLFSDGVPTQSDIGGSRGGTLDILPAQPEPEPAPHVQLEPEPEPAPYVQPEPERMVRLKPELSAQPEPLQENLVRQLQTSVPDQEPASTPEPLSPVQPANAQPPVQTEPQVTTAPVVPPIEETPGWLSPAAQIAAGAAVTGVLVAAAVKPAALLNWLRRLLHRP